jgi:hypothetical protein
MDESDVQSEKQFDPRISTFLGIKIDSSDEKENAFHSIRVKREFDSNVMDEVIYNVKNSLIQEFQHCLKSKLIEVMKMKMLSIQFVSIANLIQIQST